MRILAIRNMRRLLVDGGLSTDSWYNLAWTAHGNVQQYDLASLLLAEGEHLAPADERLWLLRAQVELALEAYPPAIAAADRVLARKPDNAEAMKCRQEAMEKLRAAAKRDTAADPASKP